MGEYIKIKNKFDNIGAQKFLFQEKKTAIKSLKD